MNDWKDYFNDRLIMEHGKFSIIVPKDRAETTPLICSICNMFMIHLDDALSYKQFQCCYYCSIKWCYVNKDKWLSGWRPSKQEIDEEVLRRKSIPLVFDLTCFSE